MSEQIRIIPVGLQGSHAMDVTGSVRMWRYFHEAYCLTFISDGLAHFRYRNRELEASTDRVFLVEPGEVHVNTRVEVPGNFFAVTLTPEQLGRLTLDDRGRLPHLACTTLKSPLLQRLMSSVVTASREDEPAAQEETLCLALEQVLLESAERRPPVPASGRERARQGAQLLREMYAAEPAKVIDIHRVAAQLGMSYYWFVHSFKETWGLPPYRFVQTLRAARARTLLAYGPGPGRRSIREIARLVGYSDAPHMARDFKRSFGMAPTTMARGVHPGWRCL